MESSSLWMEGHQPRFEAASQPQTFDVAIVGGGITGLTAGYFLKQSGKKVCVIEKGQIGGGETGHTSAHLAYPIDLRPTELSRTFGKDGLRLTLEAGVTAIDAIETIVMDLGIDCGFQRVPGFLHASLKEARDETAALKADFELVKELGFPVRFLPQGPVEGKPAVAFADNAIFHPLRYLTGLARAIDRDGSRVFENSEVTEFQEDPIRLKVNGVEIQAGSVVIGTHVPLMGNTGLVSATLFQTKLYPYSSYVVGARIPKGRFAAGLYWDTSDPYYYLRVHSNVDHDYAIFGGEDHKTGQVDDTEACFQRLEAMFRRLVPGAEIDRRWSGQVVETNDGLPFIGETAKNQFVGTGYSGNGLTFGTIAGIMAKDVALGQSNPWQKIFSPSRKKVLGGAWDFLTENMEVPYHFITGWLTQGKEKSVRSVKAGEGKVLTLDGEKVACHRDEEGTLYRCSAVCTHMGCIVRFNSAEKTWDCPCHGSRFLPTGEVIGGPAETPLKTVGRKPTRRRTASNSGS
ncbi:FAD-dependent oxidoreductase [Planctomyces sp. SH-PL14]|uniref:FAD-dependent oxidoreductase n=1 Tax=Planctomyces sp. SH-PL14 TaxID=1632864 RepID=UPI00078B7C47|nr:FAD-dependent oxidoreductase [Planctomyces sp. SH-PL14]AMV17252.1 Gamma-glutamylputrescine oxidoreductase [Planctomyces sp. SH-PL14]